MNHRAIHDPSLVLPPPLRTGAPLDTSVIPLHAVGATSEVRTRRARIAIEPGCLVVTIDGRVVARSMRDAGCRVVAHHPLGIERQCGDISESWTIIGDLPLALVERAAPLSFDIPADRDVRWNADDAVMLVERDGAFICLSCSERAAFHVVREGALLRIAASRASPSHAGDDAAPTACGNGNDTTFRVAISASADRAELERVHATDPALRLRSAAASMKRRIAELVRVQSPDAQIDAAMTRSSIAVAEADPVPVTALAALALGDYETALRVMQQDHDDASFVHLLARYHAASGDAATVRRLWPRAMRAAEQIRARFIDNVADATDTALGIAAMAAIADVARDIGLNDVSADFLAQARAARERRGDLLRAARWQSAYGGDGVATWVSILDGAFEPAFATVKSLCEMVHAAPAPLPIAFIYGTLGMEADAPRGRMRLMPAFPDEWDHLTVDNLRAGESRMRMSWQKTRTGAVTRHRFAFSQTDGAVPVRLVFEPLLTGNAVVSAVVDGRNANLDPCADRGRLRVPLQMVLDDERTVEIAAT